MSAGFWFFIVLVLGLFLLGICRYKPNTHGYSFNQDNDEIDK